MDENQILDDLGNEISECGDENSSILGRIFCAAREGMMLTIFSLLEEKSEEEKNQIINQRIYHEGQRCTPLTVAATYGHKHLVKILLEKFNVDVEAEGAVKIDGFLIEGASALWCAAASGHLGIVKTLVKFGANVDHPTHTLSTPIRAACFDGRLDIVKYLTHHNANIHTANKYNNTCLMIAAYKGHSDVVNFLLDTGADANIKAQCGATALHFAAENGHCAIVKELLNRGVEITKKENGMTALLTAAERTNSEVVKCLVENSECSKEEIVDAYELLGASFANDKDNYCLTKAYTYLEKAMILRHSDPNNILHKKLGQPNPVYENRRECETLEQLESIKDNHNALHMESLAIRERVLGRKNPEVPHSIIYRGAVLADNRRFDRCVDLWLYALQLKQGNGNTVGRDLLRFAQVFSQMIHCGVDLHVSQVNNVLEVCIIELEKESSTMDKLDTKDDSEQSAEKLELNLTTTLYILTILTKVLTVHRKEYTTREVDKSHYLVHKLCALKLCWKDGQTLLHLAVNAATPVDDFHTNDVCKFPCAATAKLLIKCGADVNAMDNERNTPLHVIVGYEKSISDFLTLHSIMMNLIGAGAHMDTVNNSGKTPYEASTTGVAEIILRAETKLSLQCMAAKVVKMHNLSYHGSVPRSLESFIELHGPKFN